MISMIHEQMNIMNSYRNKVVIILHNSFGSHLCYWVCRDILLIGVTKSMN